LELVTQSSGETFFAEISQERYRSLNVVEGATVFAAPRSIRVFGDHADVE
jgi:TOBE domain-containing protein